MYGHINGSFQPVLVCLNIVMALALAVIFFGATALVIAALAAVPVVFGVLIHLTAPFSRT